MNLKHLTTKIVSQNFQLNDPIEKIIFKQFQRVTIDTGLSLASRILETDEFVAVIDENNRPVSVFTHLQLLSFIANESKATGGVAAKAIPSILKATNELNLNGHSNGHTK